MNPLISPLLREYLYFLRLCSTSIQIPLLPYQSSIPNQHVMRPTTNLLQSQLQGIQHLLLTYPGTHSQTHILITVKYLQTKQRRRWGN